VTYPNPKNWGLGRISHKARGDYSSYIADSTLGAGTCVYVVDSGITPRVQEFGLRAFTKANFVPNENGTDGFGHGTHVAGIFGSESYGVAKKALIWAVKIFTAGGTEAPNGYAKAVEFILQDAPKEKANCPKGFIVNMSLGSGANEASDRLADSLIQAGYHVIVAAGNGNQDASNTSPARQPSVCTIGNIDKGDNIWRGFPSSPNGSASNWGPVVDLYAPGVDIQSTWPNQQYSSDYSVSTYQSVFIVERELLIMYCSVLYLEHQWLRLMSLELLP
jgi:subtilisin family serine protease